MNEKQITENLKKCPHFNTCSQNLCPLDPDRHLRPGGTQDKCRWCKNPEVKKINGREFIGGGTVMPDGILIFVPERNLNWLNDPSRMRQGELIKYARNQ